MVIKFIRFGLLITTIQFILGASCNKDNSRPCRNGYSFDATSIWNPEKQTYTVGDTIILSSEISKTLNDLVNPSLVINYSNTIAIGGGIGIGYLDTITRTALPGRNYFDLVTVIGSLTESSVAPDQGPAFIYKETLDKYELKVGLICKQKGIYGLSVSNLKSPGIRGKNCTNADFSMTVTNPDKHISLYQYALGFLPDADGMKRIYCFRVQ
ncbi:MAG: hypothetical protein WKF85_10905 [Chitinophagaceae bacterium]